MAEAKVADGEPEEMDRRVEAHEEPDQKLTMRLIRKCCASSWTQGADSAEALLATKVLRLDFQRIAAIDNLEPFTHITDLYLQHNRIQVLENLETLTQLRFLALSHNRITTIQNLGHLKQLEFLDLSHNRIDSFRVGAIPDSVLMLNLSGNKCCDDEHYRLQLVLNLPNLRMLDKAEVGRGERRMLQTVLGLPVDSSSEEEEDDDDEDDDSDAGAGGKEEGDTPAVAVVDRAKVRAQVAALSTEPSAVMRMREELRQQAAKHKAELEALRKELAASSLTKLDSRTAAEIARTRAQLEERRRQIVAQSRTRREQDQSEFARRKPMAERASADDLE